ncbi:MAG: polysaccharide deacetylase family protein [Myxococcaceae bacterium]|nr:polysaccharide deacetylase family protein [Myxococcaceae bacterium]
MSQRLSSISVDLDSLGHYCRIQGLSEGLLDERARALVWTTAVPRFLELFSAVGTAATFFVIGGDLAEPGLGEALKTAAASGVELANHSFSHDYALSRRSRVEIEADLRRAHEAIVNHTRVTPVGFRAPGYTLSPAMLQAVAALGYRYDSSTFPAAPYWLAKAMVMTALAALGRPSRAILDSPNVLLAPVQPYRPSLDAPYRRGDAPFVELPMSVSPVGRVPFIGTFATSMPWPLVELTFRRLRHVRHFNFELHAIDVLDESDGVPAALVRQQRDVRVPATTKLARLKRLFTWLGDDRERVTVAEAARRLDGRLDG